MIVSSVEKSFRHLFCTLYYTIQLSIKVYWRNTIAVNSIKFVGEVRQTDCLLLLIHWSMRGERSC